MCNLIHANMKRIWKTRVFQISTIIITGLALFQDDRSWYPDVPAKIFEIERKRGIRRCISDVGY